MLKLTLQRPIKLSNKDAGASSLVFNAERWNNKTFKKGIYMNWEPISELELWDYINNAEIRMNIEQQRLWEVIRIDPQKWQEKQYGTLGGGFWVVAIIGQSVIWFNDIEDGFNISQYKQYGVISEYWCNEDELEFAIQRLLDCIQQGYNFR